MRTLLFYLFLFFSFSSWVYGAAANPKHIEIQRKKVQEAARQMARAQGQPVPAQSGQAAAVPTRPGQVYVSQGEGPAQDQGFRQAIAGFRISSAAWPRLSDPQVKFYLVSHFIQEFQEQGIKITRPPSHYVNAVDKMTASNPEVLSYALPRLVQNAAIMEYDFGNGQNKDLMAKRLLGTKNYLKNKRRLGI